jgi:hypothetical protein
MFYRNKSKLAFSKAEVLKRPHIWSCFMRKARSFFLFLLILGLVFPLAAQESEPESEPEIEAPGIIWDTYTPERYRAGDMHLNITAGTIIPMLFTGPGMDGHDHNISIGGMGSLAFSYFFTPNWFFGGELRGMFAGTGAGNNLFIVTIGPYVGYQFTLGRFEFPIRLMTGISPQTYVTYEYFGWIINPGASVFFRYNTEWSFGLNFQWWMLPQWPEKGNNLGFVFGNFLEISLTVRYHLQ